MVMWHGGGSCCPHKPYRAPRLRGSSANHIRLVAYRRGLGSWTGARSRGMVVWWIMGTLEREEGRDAGDEDLAGVGWSERIADRKVYLSGRPRRAPSSVNQSVGYRS